MTIKRVLFGSIAGLLSATDAQSADAVVMVEPEPTEYVRVCDVYGTGFFYIPGTETCLQISGYVRARVIVEEGIGTRDLDDAFLDADGDLAFDDEETRMGTRIRARLDFDAREETELGTLRGFVRLQAENTGNGSETGDEPYGMDEGYIQLGGLTIGYLDSAWTNDDGGIEDGLLLEETDFAAGDFQQNRLSYTYAANGFSGTVSLEDDGTGDFVPDVIGKLAYTGGFGGAYVMGVFDEESYSSNFANDVDFASLGVDSDVFGTLIIPEGYAADDSAFALKAGLLLENLLAEDSSFKIEGHYAFDPTEYAVVETLGSQGLLDSNFVGSSVPSEYQIGAAYGQEFGRLFLAVNGVYGETFELEVANGGFFDGFEFVGDVTSVGSADYFGVGANVGYEITSNLSLLGEVSYRDIDLPADVDDYDQTAGYVEIKREF